MAERGGPADDRGEPAFDAQAHLVVGVAGERVPPQLHGLAGGDWVWRRVEPHIPDWLTRLVIGSARAPEYALTPAPVTSDGAHVITGVVDTTELAHLALMRDALDEGDPARTRLEKILQ